MIGFSAVLTARAGEGRLTRTGVDNDGLALRWCAHPQVNVVSTVSLKQGRHMRLLDITVGIGIGGPSQYPLSPAPLLQAVLRDEREGYRSSTVIGVHHGAVVVLCLFDDEFWLYFLCDVACFLRGTSAIACSSAHFPPVASVTSISYRSQEI